MCLRCGGIFNDCFIRRLLLSLALKEFVCLYIYMCLCVCVYVCVQQKTRAAHRLVDDVSDDVKRRRHDELAKTFRLCAHQLNQSLIGQRRVVLVDRVSHSVSLSVCLSHSSLL